MIVDDRTRFPVAFFKNVFEKRRLGIVVRYLNEMDNPNPKQKRRRYSDGDYFVESAALVHVVTERKRRRDDQELWYLNIERTVSISFFSN